MENQKMNEVYYWEVFQRVGGTRRTHYVTCDTDDPVFPQTRRDVCAVRRIASENRLYPFSNICYNNIYLLWKVGGKLHGEELIEHGGEDYLKYRLPEYLQIKDILEDGEDIVVKVRSGKDLGGGSWEKELRRKKTGLGIEERLGGK